MRIAITGSSGLVGRRLAADLAARGHDVLRVTRAAAGPGSVTWDPAARRIDAGALDGVDAIVHLAGETVGQRWSSSARARILESRVDGTRTIAEAAASLARPPAVLVCASAVGVYGDRGDEELSESSPRGAGFLADVVTAWEAAAQPARDAGIRTVHLRTGIVLSPEGGALKSLLPPFRLGLGGRVGSGKQWWPWLTLDDTVAAYRFTIESDLSGPVNLAAGAARNADFTRALGRVLRRPTIFPLPAVAVRAGFGQMGVEMLLGGQRLLTPALDAAGFAFADRELEPALRHVLTR
jgi:uncharacterized protein (TIGR01777 family)